MSTNTTLPAHTRFTPLRKWWGSTRLAYRIAWQDLRRHTASTILALLLVIIPIVTVLVLTTWAASQSTKQAGQQANPQDHLIATVVASQNSDDPTTYGIAATPQRLLDDLTAHGATSAWGYSLTSHHHPLFRFANIAHMTGNYQDMSPLQLLDGRWPTSDRELAITPYGNLGHLHVGDTIDIDTEDLSSTIRYTVVGKTAGPLGQSTRTIFPTVQQLAGITAATPEDPLSASGWTFFADAEDKNQLQNSLHRQMAGGKDSITWRVTHPTRDSMFIPALADSSSDELYILTFFGFVTMVMSMMSTPSLLIASKRHQKTLSIARHQGSSPATLRHVMSAQAVLLTATTVLVSVLIVAMSAYGLERWRRSPSIGDYDYSTVINYDVAFLGFATLTIGMLIAAAILAHRVTAPTSASTARTAGVSPALLRTTAVLAFLSAASLYAMFRHVELGMFGAYITPIYMLALAFCLAPIVIVALSTLRGPAWLRYGLRDANRNKARTVPIVGAVTAATALAVFTSGLFQATDVREDSTYQDQALSITRVQNVPYGSAIINRLSADAARLQDMDGVDFARPQAHTDGMPHVTYYDTNGFVPNPSPANGTIDSSPRNSLVAIHPSCQVGPEPDPKAPEQRYLGRVTCTHNFTGVVSGGAASGVYVLRVAVVTPEQAAEQFSLSDEAQKAFAEGTALWFGGPMAPETVRLIAWDNHDYASGDWVYSKPRTQDLPNLNLANDYWGEMVSKVVVSPTVAESLGVDTTLNSLTVGLNSNITESQMNAINAALPVTITPRNSPRQDNNLQRTETIGLWIGGGILQLFISLLILLNSKQVVQESRIVAMLGGRRRFFRLSLASQLGALTALGILMGFCVGTTYLATLFHSYQDSFVARDTETDRGWGTTGELVGLASWPTLLTVMAVVVLTSMAIAASTAPRAKLTTKRQ